MGNVIKLFVIGILFFKFFLFRLVLDNEEVFFEIFVLYERLVIKNGCL